MQTLAQEVERVLAEDSDIDGDAVWDRLEQALKQHPEALDLLHLRLRLARAFGMREQEAQDLATLVRLCPDDLDLGLQEAVLAHRRALFMDDDAQQQRQQDAALARLKALAARGRGDAAFQDRLLQAWSDSTVDAPWVQLACALWAAAAHPQHPGLRRALRRVWNRLAWNEPDQYLPNGQLPMGFNGGVLGQTIAPALAQRTLQLLDTELQAAADDADALQCKAELQLGLSLFPEAAASFRLASAAWSARANATPDAEERDELTDKAEQAGRQAGLCERGRAALSNQAMADLADVLSPAADQERSALADRLLNPVAGAGATQPADAGGREASAEATAFLAQWEAERKQRLAALSDELKQVEAAAGVANAEPSAEQRAQWQDTARKVAQSLKGVLAFEPMGQREWRGPDEALDIRLQQARTRAGEMGWQPLGWVETPAYTERFGALTLAGVWAHPQGDAWLLWTAVSKLELCEVETELSDGAHLITNTGQNFLGGGPRIDQLAVPKSLPLDDLVDLHRARVAWALAQRPGVAVRPWRDAEEVIAAWDRQRLAKLDHRLAVGLDDTEARSVPADQPEVFVPLLREAALAVVRDAEASWRQR